MIHLSQVAGVRSTITNIHEDLGYLQQTVETLVCNMFVFLPWLVDCYWGCLASIGEYDEGYLGVCLDYLIFI